MKRLISSKHLEGVSDLTLVAPIKQGFIDAFESVTYETRLKAIMEALFKIRSTAREHSVIKPFVDTAERIQALLDFRLTVIDTEPRQLLLSATFDRPFEPYMRLIWDPLGPLLDVIFCNCDGYVTATEHSFPEYLAWVRKSQIDTDFFYAASGHSVSDVQYAIKIERLQREGRNGSATGVVVDDLSEMAKKVRTSATTRNESNQMGMQALVALYRLADMYPPDRPEGDGKYLRWAAQQLLEGWGRAELGPWANLVVEQLAWLEADPLKKAGNAAEQATPLQFKASDIQGGILTNFGDGDRPVRHGAILLMGITDPEKARKFIGDLPVQHQPEGEEAAIPEPFLSLAFTRHGLVNIGIDAATLERFPQEFREGMEERAGLLGDVRDSHPRRWNLPRRHRAAGTTASEAADAPVDMSEIDIVIQLRTTVDRNDDRPLGEADHHPLDAMIARLVGDPESGVRLLAVEEMHRASPPTEKVGRDHFGFVDGLSQPKPVDHAPARRNDEVARGEIFWGYCNNRADQPPPASEILDNGTFLVLRKLRQDVPGLRKLVAEACAQHAGEGLTEEILYGKMMGRTRDGMPMLPWVPEKSNAFGYREDPKGEQCPFQAHIRRTNPRDDKSRNNGRPTPRILRRGLSYGPPFREGEPENVDRGVFFMAYNASIAEQFEVIQRWINGGNSTGVGSWQNDPLMGVGQKNDPRTFCFRHNGATLRISIPDPFVKLQWGAYLFVPSMTAIRRIAALEPDAQALRAAAELELARRGETIVAKLQALAADGPQGRVAAAAGWKTCLEDFGSKDPGERGDGPAVWAAIRLYHGGVLRVPYGIVEAGESPRDAVLVGSKGLVMRVFRESRDLYSMRGQMKRMKQSFGPIFLGLDGGDEYDEKSKINADILAISEGSAFAVAYGAAASCLENALQVFCRLYGPEDKGRERGRAGELDLRRNFITPVLAGVCNYWFGIPDTLEIDPDERLKGPGALPVKEAGAVDKCDPGHVLPGGWSWKSDRKPRCPGDYMSTSRYCFYPDPVPRVQAYGKQHGQGLRKAVRAHFEQLEREGKRPEAPLAAKMKEHFGRDVDELARTLIGVMTGFLPPADGSLRWTLYEWLEEKIFWRLQQQLVSAEIDETAVSAATEAAVAEIKRMAKAARWPEGRVEPAVAKAEAAVRPYLRARAALSEPLVQAMQNRPAPDMLWRTATRNHRLGGIEIEEGDRIFVGIVSAMAEDVTAGVTDAYPVFGGKREAEGENFPLHACPAYQFAMGTMLGILAALMDRVRIETLPAPLLVRISDRTACPARPSERRDRARTDTLPSQPAREETGEPALTS